MPNYAFAASSLLSSEIDSSRSSHPSPTNTRRQNENVSNGNTVMSRSSSPSTDSSRNISGNHILVHPEFRAIPTSELNQYPSFASNNHLTIEERDQFVRHAFGDVGDDDDDDVDDDEIEGFHDAEEDDDDEDDETGEVVQSIFRAHIVDRTRLAYHRSQRKFVCWIFKQSTSHIRISEQERYRNMLHPELLTTLTEESLLPKPKLETKVTPFIETASEQFHPIKLSL